MKKIILSTILVFLGLVYASQSFAESKSKTIVYYFWSKPRCISCKKIETYTKETLNESFPKELKDGSIELKVIDFTKEKSYQKKYGLFTKSVVLSKIQNGKEVKHKNLDKIWTKLNNKIAFKNYIKTEIIKFTK